jgi:hypothetical protein
LRGTVIASDTTLGMNPHVPAEFTGRRRQRRHGELIEAVLFCRLSYELAHRCNFRFCVDADFRHLGIAMVNAGRSERFHGSISTMLRRSQTFASQQ